MISLKQAYQAKPKQPTRKVGPFPGQGGTDELGLPPMLSFLSFGFLALLLLILVGFFAWSWLGVVEESVPGVGQIVPEGKIKKVMAPANGIVSEVYVTENQHVTAGQRLIVLDPESVLIEKGGFQEELDMLQQQARALQAAATGSSPGRLNPIQQAWLESTKRSYQSQAQEIEMQVEAAKHAHQQAIAQQKSLQTIINSKSEQLQKLQNLYEQGGLTKKELTDYEQEVQVHQGELNATSEVVATRKAEIDQAQSRQRTLKDKYRQDLMGRVLDHSDRMTALRTRIAQAQLSMKREVIVAPISGTINEQIVHGKGEVVVGGHSLMTIVPDDASMVAEVKVANRDLSYIHLGQKVSLRMDAFPYHQFGRLLGDITSISPSSHADEEGNQYFMVKVKPERTTFKDDKGKVYHMRAGMSVTADIVTRNKQILSFFTESMHERFDRAFREPTTR